MTQERLLDIAIVEFGRHGLEGASTRQIAAAAGTAMSSITYHYGGKEGLFLAAADHIAARLAADMEPTLVQESAVEAPTPEAARASLHKIVDRFIDKMADGRTASWSLFIVREQMQPTEAFDRIYAGLMGRMLERLARLVMIAGHVADERHARLVVITLIGQVIVMRSARASSLKFLGHRDLDPVFTADLKRQVAFNINAILDQLAADRQEPA